MSIDRKSWLSPFEKNSIPNWMCPSCLTGILRPVNGSFHYWESAESRTIGKQHRLQYYQLHEEMLKEISNPNVMLGWELSSYRYSVLLMCNDPNCLETVASCGSGFVVQGFRLGHGEPDEEFDVFVPEYFFPALLLFSLPRKCPKTVSEQIRASFKLFFADPPASANYVRKAVEEILTDRGIKRFMINKKKNRREKISLHDRIVEFQNRNPENADKLLALKWLGNEGSHTNKISKNDILDAYEILEIVIDDLYAGNRALIDKKIARINKSKGPLHPST